MTLVCMMMVSCNPKDEDPINPDGSDGNGSYGKHEGHEWVDLGLPSGLKWATCNVGATKPEEYGNYYAWGETATKSEYTENNSLTSGLSISELQSQGIIDGNSNLMPQHDAATANWGGDWRMPTDYELKELITKCTWEWINTNDFKGYSVIGPNGNSIFLPAAGYRGESSLNYAGSNGGYRSSTPSDDDYEGLSAGSLNFRSDLQIMGNSSRYTGRSVRPVVE